MYMCESMGGAWSCRNRARSVWRGRGGGKGREGSISLLCTLDPITFRRRHKAQMMLDVAAESRRCTGNGEMVGWQSGWWLD